MKKTTRYLMLVVLVLLVLFLGIAIEQSYFSAESNKNSVPVVLEKKSDIDQAKPAQIKISIVVGKLTLQPTVSSGTSLYDVLMTEKNNNQLTLNGKTSPGLGFYVTEIGELKSTDKKFIVYYINGQSATVGISAYYPKEGDVIEWKYAD